MHALDRKIEPYLLLNHPFYQRWMEGTLSMEELRRYAANYFPHVAAFPTYVSAVHSHAQDMKLRQALLENLVEEELGEENHPELWLRFAEGLDLDRGDIARSQKLSEATALVNTFRYLTKKSLASGLGALYAYESQVPKIAQQKIDGLKKHYGFEDGRSTAFFEVHIQADVYHSQTSREAIDRLSDSEKTEAEAAAQEAALALWKFLSALDREAGIQTACH